MPLRLSYLQVTDLGPDATATVQLVDRDDLDRDSRPETFAIPLRAAEKQAIRDVIDRARLRFSRRLDKAKADRQANPNAPVNLSTPVENEDAP